MGLDRQSRQRTLYLFSIYGVISSAFVFSFFEFCSTEEPFANGGESLTNASVRVFICGAHSTGKTTLCQSILGDEFISVKRGNLCGQPEIARTVIQQMGVNRDQFVNFRQHPRIFEFVQHEISREQSRIEAKNDLKQINVLYDRGIDPVVYSWLYLGKEARNRLLAQKFLQKSVQRYRESVVFVMTPSRACIVDDGFRMTPNLDDLIEYTSFMKRLLEELNIPFHIIEVTDQMQRTQFVLDIIKSKLEQRNKNPSC